MNFESLGIITGILVGIVASIFIYKACNKNGEVKTKYDERQEVLRGRAYKYAMITAWVLMGLFAALDACDIIIPVETSALLFTILVISALVHIGYSIWNDAYWGSNNNVRSYVIVFFVITVINILATIGYIKDGVLIQNGMLTYKIMNAECAVMFLIIGIEFLLRSFLKKEEVEDEE